MASTLDILKRLRNHGVEFVVVGGTAGISHGSSIVTKLIRAKKALGRATALYVAGELIGRQTGQVSG